MVADFKKLARWLAGRRLVAWQETILDIAHAAVQYAEDRVNDPARVRRELDGLVGEWVERQAQRNIQHSREIAEDGEFLLQLKAKHGPSGWPLMLRRLHLSKRMYFKCIAIAILRRRIKDAFDTFARLGPEKLFALAVLAEDAVWCKDREEVIETKRGPVKLRYLTDDELKDYWVQVTPKRERNVWRQLDRDLSRMDRRITKKWAERKPPRPLLATLLAKTHVLERRIESLMSGVA